jgi:chemotaxis-related protein WspB
MVSRVSRSKRNFMLFLGFQVGDEKYLLAAKQVVEVIPLVQCRHIPHAPPEVAGVCDCHGTPVPVVDLSAMLLGIPARQRMSTRIVVVNYTLASGQKRLLGLMAEQVMETVSGAKADFKDSGPVMGGRPYLGPIVQGPDGMMQCIEVQGLLSDDVRGQLFPEGLAIA